MLQKLASWIPTDGPCIKLFPLIPEDTPTWNSQVQTTPKQPDWDYWEVSATLTQLCKEGSLINIYCKGTISNKDHEDGAQLGTSATVIYQGGKEKGHTEQVLRQMVMELDARLQSLTTGLNILTDHLTSQDPNAHASVVICLASNHAVSKALDTTPHINQQISIAHAE